MKIGIVGPQASCGIIEKSLNSIDSSIDVLKYEKDKINEMLTVIGKCEQECDAILFTGCVAEDFIENNYNLKKPFASVEKSITTLSIAFFHMQKNNLEFDSFSIDIVEKQIIEDLLDSFKISPKNIYLSPHNSVVDEEKYVEWHINLQRENKTNVALTSFVWVHNKIIEQGYPSIYLEPTRATVRVALERLKSKYELNKSEYSKLAIEILQLSNYQELSNNYYTGMIKKTEIEKEIILYVKGNQGAMYSYGRYEYIVFSNAGILQSDRSMKNILELQTKIESMGLKMNAGIGTGITVYKAEMNARKALEYSLKRRKMEIFQIGENDILEGPIGAENILKYELITTDVKIRDIAKKTGLSEISILKITAIADARKSYVFDANELAECLEITVRSSRRIINKIMDSGLGRIHSKETSITGGRPKKLVELLFE